MTTFIRISLSAFLLAALLGQPPALASARVPTTSFVVNSSLDEIDLLLNGVCQSVSGVCTLRAALMEANAAPGIDTINIPAGVYTLTITGANEDATLTGDLDVTEAVRINGDPTGQTIIDGGGLDRVFDVLSSASGQLLEMRDLTIRKGGGSGFAGVRLQSGTQVLIEQATITDNVGSGIRNDALLLTLNRVTVVGNSTTGLYNTGDTVNISNSTFSGNLGANGGGLYTDSGAISLNNTTIANNIAITGGGLYRTGSANVLMQNSIVAGNSADTGPDCSGILFSVTFSLIQNASSCTFGGSNNLLGIDPLLTPLQNNGGPTLTHALGLTSPALNAGDPGGCKDAQSVSLTTDQRGTTRPQPTGGRCDMGAYEVPTVQFSSANFSADENAGQGVITATLDGVSALTVTVPYTASNGTALAGSDYVTTTSVLTFPPNTLAMTFTVPLLEDPLDEADETVALTLGSPSGAALDTPLTATLAIVDNDLPPEFYLTSDEYSVNENAGPALITATLNAESGVTVTVNYSTTNGSALAGSDYTSASGMLTFSPGLTTATFSVPIVNDDFYESDETLSLHLGQAVNALPGLPEEAILTLVNDDSPRLFLPFIGRNTFSCWAGPNEIEPNGSTAQANGPLCFDGRPYAGGDSTPFGTLDWDYYTLFWPQSGQFTVRLTGPALGLRLQVQMYYQTISSNTLVGFSASSPYLITCPPGNNNCTGAAGLYYILVFMPTDYNGSGYTLTVTTP